MYNKIKNLFLASLDRISRRFRPKRLTFRDWVTNIYLKTRWRFLLLINSSKIQDTSPRERDGMVLTFEDNFNKMNWDKSGYDKWRIGEHWGIHHPQRPNVWYGPPEFKDGKTKFVCKYNPKEFTVNDEKRIVPFEVSLLSSAKWFTQQYGRFECRMQLPKAKWSWPAFWMWGPTWPPEIDVVEAYGRNTGTDAIYQEPQLHWGETYRKEGSKTFRAWMWKLGKKSDLHNKFWEFAVEWKPDKIEFFTNGVKLFQFTNKKILDKYFQNGPMWMVINNSIRNYSKHDKDYWSEFEVDYIRAYKFK